jgi:3-oxoacyl-[acyl-carrier-protein] synthase-3
MTDIRVAGWGRAHPPRQLTNLDLEATLDTSDEWIRERTGIVNRYVGGDSAELGTEAGRIALERAGMTGADVELLIVATSTPAQLMPGAYAQIAESLGITSAAFDLNGACAGFTYGLISASGLLTTGPRTALVVGVDAMSAITDPSDRGTAILFGDGAGAVVLRALDGDAPADQQGGLLGWHAGTDGAARSILFCDRGGWIQMEGQAVFKIAVRAAVDSARVALERAEMKPGDVDLFIPHQANQRITDAIASRLGLQEDRVVSTLADTGNSSAGTIPYALAVAADDGRIRDGAVVLMSGFGAGMTWATALFRWSTS